MARYSVVDKSAKRIKKRKLMRRFALFVVALIIISIAIAAWVYWKSMTPAILDIAQTRLTAETTFAVNQAVYDALAECGDYDDLVKIERNSQNEIVMITANSTVVNALARNTAMLSQNKINALDYFDIDIPLGTLSGIPLLSDKGPTVKVTVTPIGSVTCTFNSVFETAGINQTLHRIYINVNSKVDLIMPTSHMEVETVTPILLCESLIIGNVPETFLQGGLLLGAS